MGDHTEIIPRLLLVIDKSKNGRIKQWEQKCQTKIKFRLTCWIVLDQNTQHLWGYVLFSLGKGWCNIQDPTHQMQVLNETKKKMVSFFHLFMQSLEKSTFLGKKKVTIRPRQFS